jgi:benzylsuccinate CoA-transferase BbsF subunit
MTECSSDRVFKPLAGIRVADFSWVIAGPWLTKILAYFGAEVIRIESRSQPDAIRLYHDPEHGLSSIGRRDLASSTPANLASVSIYADRKRRRLPSDWSASATS